MKIQVGMTQLDATIQSRPSDTSWGGRESKALTFAGSYEQAVALFQNDVKWTMLREMEEKPGWDEVDLSEFALAGPVTDNRDGTVTVKMGKYLQEEIIAMTIGQAPTSHAAAMTLRGAIEAAVQHLDDDTAAGVVSLFPALKEDGTLVRAGTRINWGGRIIRAKVDLWDRADHNPEHAPTLWEGME